jgi:nucleosome binding factor SPN SPT16 subunit
LVGISEFPFFVAEFDEMEVVSFEQLRYGIKKFRMTFVSTSGLWGTIHAVPIEYMEVIKKCLDFFRVPYFDTVSQIDWHHTPLSGGEILLGNGTWWHSLMDDVEQGDSLRTLEDEEEEEDERESSNSWLEDDE